MLIVGSSDSSGRLAGEQHPDEHMRGGGRPLADEAQLAGLAGGRGGACARMARGWDRDGGAERGERGDTARPQR